MKAEINVRNFTVQDFGSGENVVAFIGIEGAEGRENQQDEGGEEEVNYSSFAGIISPV